MTGFFDLHFERPRSLFPPLPVWAILGAIALAIAVVCLRWVLPDALARAQAKASRAGRVPTEAELARARWGAFGVAAFTLLPTLAAGWVVWVYTLLPWRGAVFGIGSILGALYLLGAAQFFRRAIRGERLMRLPLVAGISLLWLPVLVWLAFAARGEEL